MIDGQDVVTKIENIKTDPNCRPLKEVKISDCGEMVLRKQHKGSLSNWIVYKFIVIIVSDSFSFYYGCFKLS